MLQFAALGLVLVGTAVLARRAFGRWVDGWPLWLAVGLLQLEAEHFKVARQLFNENLYMPLVMVSLIVVVWSARRAADRLVARSWSGVARADRDQPIAISAVRPVCGTWSCCWRGVAAAPRALCGGAMLSASG